MVERAAQKLDQTLQNDPPDTHHNCTTYLGPKQTEYRRERYRLARFTRRERYRLARFTPFGITIRIFVVRIVGIPIEKGGILGDWMNRHRRQKGRRHDRLRLRNTRCV
jgi:hypothetical protein